jgi:hypothetical protein
MPRTVQFRAVARPMLRWARDGRLVDISDLDCWEQLPKLFTGAIFGWDERAPGSISFQHVEQRWGWNTKETAPHAKEWCKNIIVRPVYLETVEIVSMPPPEHKPRSSSPERKRELARLRVARFRARQKVLRAAAEGRCNAD